MPDYDVITYTRPDGQVINLSDPPYMVEAYDGFGIGEFDHTTVSPPGSHGEYWYDTRMAAKVLSITYVYIGDGVVERLNARRDVVRLFNPLMGPGVLRIAQANGITRDIDCILAESLPLPSEEFLGPGSYRTVVRFKSHGVPAFRDPTLNSIAVAGGTSSSTYFPWSFPRTFAQSGFFYRVQVTNVGDIDTPVRLTMRGPLNAPIFRNETTGKTVSLPSLVLGIGDVLLIDTDPTKYVVQVNGVDRWDLLSDTDFWDLVPGINTILFDIGGGTINTGGTLEWYTRELGR